MHSAPQHTPPPWMAWPDCDEDGNTGLVIIGTPDGEPIVCTCAGTTEQDTNLVKAAPALLEALELAIRAMNDTPSFRTRLPDPEHPHRTLSSYRLLPRLEAIVRQARGLPHAGETA